jgi:hypothetical protein
MQVRLTVVTYGINILPEKINYSLIHALDDEIKMNIKNPVLQNFIIMI